MRWLHKVSFGNRGRRLGIPVGVAANCAAAIRDDKRQRRKLRTTTTTAATDFAIVKILDKERESPKNKYPIQYVLGHRILLKAITTPKIHLSKSEIKYERKLHLTYPTYHSPWSIFLSSLPCLC